MTRTNSRSTRTRGRSPFSPRTPKKGTVPGLRTKKGKVPGLRKANVQAQIDRMVQRIVRKFHPEKIILFGSQARGDAGPDSDVDLLIVMPVAGSKCDKRLEIRRAAGYRGAD